MLWLDSQVLVFGSWEEREHGPSHSLGKRCLPSWVALALPTEVDTHVDRQTDRHTSLCLLLLVRRHPRCCTHTQLHPLFGVSTPDENGPRAQAHPIHTNTPVCPLRPTAPHCASVFLGTCDFQPAQVLSPFHSLPPWACPSLCPPTVSAFRPHNEWEEEKHFY